MIRIVPENIVFAAITKEGYIERHVSAFHNELYNPQPEIPRVIAYIDGTYSTIDKSRSFRTLRQSYCLHKWKHLFKPASLVAPDGYILNIQGPYFSDSPNNDAAMLRNEFDRDARAMREWFEEKSILIVDRDYRDATLWLQELGISWHMPALLERGRRQFST